jgi:dienelactone hydrolase
MLAVAASARAAPPPLEAYARLPFIEAIALSPSGERFALAVNGKEGRSVIVRTNTGAPVAGLSYKASRITRLEFAGENHLLIFQVSTKDPRYPRQDVVDFNLATNKSFGFFASSWGYVSAWRGVRQIGGRWYAYVSDPVGSLDRIDLETSKSELIASAGGKPHGWLVGQDGQVVASTVFDPRGLKWSVYGGIKTDAPLVEDKGADAVEVASAGRRPGTILLEERLSDSFRFREVRLDGKDEGEVLAAGEAATGSIVDRDTGLLVGLTTVRGQKLFDPALQKRIDDSRTAFSDERSRLVTHSRNFERMIFYTTSAHDAGRYWFVDTLARTASPMGQTYPEVPPDEVGENRVFKFKAADGLELEGVLTLPPGRPAKNLPVVIMPHGGPIVAGDQPGFDWWAQAYAARGYAVFQPNFRGSLGYGDAFRVAGNGEFGKKMLSDISDGLSAVAEAGIVDRKRACIVGASYGGYAALAGVTLQQGLYRCAVSVAGIGDVDDLRHWTRDHSNYFTRELQQQQWRAMTGVEPGSSGDISPRRAAARADAPVLLLHGEEDWTVPIDQSKDMRKALESAKRPVEYLSLGKVDHHLDDATARLAMLNAAVAFVQKHNPAD